MSSVCFILGRPGSGKTHACLQEIESMVNGGAPLYLLIPEQFSLQAEKMLLTARSASVNVQALSFNRLAYRIFAKLGGPKGKLLDEAGRNMLLRKIMFECADELTYYKSTSDKQGFIDKLARAVTEFNHYRVTPADLRLRAPESDEVLSGKLTDLAMILEKYRNAVTDQYLLTDDMLELLCQRLNREPPGKGILSGGYFWIDGFYSFTPQELNVIKYLIQNAERVTFAFTCVKGNPLFEPARETVDLISSAAKQVNADMLPEIYLAENKRHTSAPGLKAFTEGFSVSKPAVPNGLQNKEIAVISAADGYASAYEAARRCVALVNERNYRFRDIAVLCEDGGKQSKILQTVFDRFKIPLFQDAPVGVMSHPLTELIRSALETVTKGWQFESVMRFLKTGLTNLTADEVDRLENYILARGITNYKWKYPFADESEETRGKVLACMAAFENLRAESKASVIMFCRKITDMLYALEVPEKLSAMHRSRMDAGDPDTARIHRQIWPKVCDTLDKLAEILGDEVVTLRTFAKLLDAGLSQADLGRIPPTVDQVFLGDAGRTRYPQIKAMIVIGANDGKLPANDAREELLSEYEREQLENTALKLSPNADGRMNGNWYALYCALCQPSEELTVIYAESEGGKTLRPSPLVGKLKQMFPGMEIKSAAQFDEVQSVEINYCSKNIAGENSIFHANRNLNSNTSARSGDTYTLSDETTRSGAYVLSKETTHKLYGKTVITAASRLEKFASCPFAYYAAYNLKARERKVYDVHPADLGVLYHAVLEEFTKSMDASGTDWGSLDRTEISAYVDNCVESLLSEPDNVLRDTARNMNVLRKVKRICVTSLWALCKHVKRGAYKPYASEVAFASDSGSLADAAEGLPVAMLEVRLDNDRRLLLTGRIDRMDLLRTDAGCFVKIIDYKSGKVKFDMAEVMQGTQLQLVTYMNALVKNAQRAMQNTSQAEPGVPSQNAGANETGSPMRPGGIFYFHLDDPILNSDSILDDERREELLLECFKMSGLAVSEHGSIEGMDSGIEVSGRSPIIPVAVNKDGTYSKSSSVVSPEYFETLGKMVEEKIKELGLKMTEGVITPEPLKRGHSLACDYCAYDAVCGIKI